MRHILLGAATLNLVSALAQSGDLDTGRFIGSHGRFEVTSIYGYPLGFAFDKTPAWVNGINGRLDLDVARIIPIAVDLGVYDHNYMNGQSNRFNVRIDHDRLMQQMAALRTDRLSGLLQQRDSLQAAMREATSKLSFLETRSSETERLRSFAPGTDALVDTSGLMIYLPNRAIPDTLPTTTTALDEFNIGINHRAIIDTMFTPPDMDVGAIPDAGAADMEQLRRTQDVLRSQLGDLEKRIAIERSLQSGTELGSGRAMRYLKNVRQFQVGRVTPPNSALLTSGVPLNGAMVEYEGEQGYVALAHGTIVAENALPVQRAAFDPEQPFNIFRGGSGVKPGKLTTGRIGFGRVIGSHAHLGLLHGTSATDISPGSSSDALRKNLAAELDLALAIDTKRSIRATYARSYSWSENNALEQAGDPASAMDHLIKDQGNDALSISATASFPKSGTNVEGSSRWVAPFYESLGLAYVKRNSVAHELRLAQTLGRKTSFRLSLRSLRYALVNGGPRVAYMTGMLRLTHKIGQRTSVSFTTAPCDQTVTNPTTETQRTGWGLLRLGIDATYRLRSGHTTAILNGSYSAMLQHGPTGSATQHQYAVSGTGKLTEQLTAQFTVSRSIMADALEQAPTIVRTLASASTVWNITEAWRTTMGLTAVFEDRTQHGGNVGMDLRIRRHINIGIKCERMILAEQFDAYGFGTVEPFGYSWTLRSTFDW